MTAAWGVRKVLDSMFISDAFFHLRQRLEAEEPTVIELQDYFAPWFNNAAFGEDSRYLAAASSFLLLQLGVWERAILALPNPALTEGILTYNHTLIDQDERPVPATVEVRKLPTAEGKLRLDLEPIEVAESFISGLAPRKFLFVITESADFAMAALNAWTAWDKPTSSVAILIKAPLPDMDPLLSAAKQVHHRIAGWLNLPISAERTDILAMFVFGEGLDEI